ncbi:PleD family two-component system response regulator [Methylovirgula sp. HY1]|uniref:PleD family two-component system response regulator n=1 Tax=Methylovirgula sp. HY1 TaxID=2822761 RepID=UPI001C5B181E|nr:PleD family two-component system response regulator [Methylovirgula sp. HY1]QXX73567.1 Response regulator PleD [Methylovirgula sp. HY1]
MTARILVVDDVLPNLKLLEARLTAEYFDVTTASNGAEALALCSRQDCDIVLLDVMMPGMDGFEVCRRLKRDPATAHIPVIMVTALDQPADRLRGLEVGADDFLTKPIDEMTLIARVRSLARLKLVLDELRARAATSVSLGMPDPLAQALAVDCSGGRILLVDDRLSSADQIITAMRGKATIDIEKDPQEALIKSVAGDYDLVIISLGLADFDALRLCSQIRSIERTRQLPILCLAEQEDRPRILRALDIGVNDFILRPTDGNELTARVRTQMRRKRYADALRDNVQASIELAVVDPLTSVHNRRYFETHLAALVAEAADRGRSLALMILDIDHFKGVNDTYGHDAGDRVLKGFTDRVRKVIRTSDLICRLGGEEFVIVMPDTSLEIAAKVAERVRGEIEKNKFSISDDGRAIEVTVSIGLAERGRDSAPDSLFRRADRALYRSKSGGRNRVSADAA